MKILETYSIKSRGNCAVVKLDGSPPALKSHVRRTSDQKTWQVRGIEFFAHRPPREGDNVGMLLAGNDTFSIGDEIECVRDQP